jgi:hypothetical protein
VSGRIINPLGSTLRASFEEASRNMTTPGPAALAALALFSAGCGGATSLPVGGTGAGGGSLVGSWTGTMTQPGSSGSETLTFDADGSAVVTATVSSGGCTGTIQVTGIQWSATAATVTLSGGGMCTGGLTCSDGTTVPCTAEATAPETCDYTLSDGDSVLVLTCEGERDVHAGGVSPAAPAFFSASRRDSGLRRASFAFT